MKILNASLNNFGSYKELYFDFQNKGLTLISGPTGSGKSTLCDVIPWVLFGKTSKNGSVDEIISWNADGPTDGSVILDGLIITRTRGPKVNDLYFYENGTMTRGKDIADTQRLINNRLGMDINMYLSGAYFHEFSQTAQFFTTTAKVRRGITEQIVDLSLASDLTEALLNAKKPIKKTLDTINSKLSNETAVLAHIDKGIIANEKDVRNWQDKQHLEINKALERCAQFDKMKEDALNRLKLEEVHLTAELVQNQFEQDQKPATCPTCGNRDNTLINKRTKLLSMMDTLSYQISNEKSKINPYTTQLAGLRNQTNTALVNLNHLWDEYKATGEKISNLEILKADSTLELSDLDALLGVVEDFRAITVKNTIVSLEESTNKLLSEHFDAEIKVKFEIEDADKLEVTIMKDGNLCAYTQLSKGQRQLLKLCFGVSVMCAVATHNAINFNVIFLDEALDGLDSNLKVKAFSLLQELDYESVFVVEHSTELKTLFTSEIAIELVDGCSRIKE